MDMKWREFDCSNLLDHRHLQKVEATILIAIQEMSEMTQ
jgi:hypothetical protein